MSEYVFTLNDTTPRVEITVEPVAAAVARQIFAALSVKRIYKVA